MTGFQCNFTGATSTTPLPPGQLPRRCVLACSSRKGVRLTSLHRCGYDPIWDTPADPSNCTYGPKLPMYWYQFEGNNMHEDPYHAPTYGDVYGFPDGAQNDIFWVNGTKPNDTSSAIPSDNTTSPVPSDDPPASSTAPPPSSSSSSYPSASSPSPSPSSPAADNVDLSDPPSSSSPSPLPSSSSPDPAQSLPSSASSPPAGNVDPSNTLPTDSDSYPPQSSSQLSPYPSSSPNPTVTTDPESTSLPGSDSYPPQSQSSSQPSPYPSSSPNPTLTTDPESQSQPPSSNPPQKSNGKCRPKSTSSSAYLSTPSPSPSPSQDKLSRESLAFFSLLTLRLSVYDAQTSLCTVARRPSRTSGRHAAFGAIAAATPKCPSTSKSPKHSFFIPFLCYLYLFDLDSAQCANSLSVAASGGYLPGAPLQ